MAPRSLVVGPRPSDPLCCCCPIAVPCTFPSSSVLLSVPANASMSQPAPSPQPVCVVVGAGTGQTRSDRNCAIKRRAFVCGPHARCCDRSSGLGASIALRFARAGYAVAICARRRETLESIRNDITHTLEQDVAKRSAVSTASTPEVGFVRAFSMDSSDEASVNAAFAEIKRELPGVIRVLVYNAAQRKFKTENILEVSTKTFEVRSRHACGGRRD